MTATSLDRRTFVRRTALALAGGLVLGDEALALFERLTHSRIFALGMWRRLQVLHLKTGLTAGMFSVYAKPAVDYDGFGAVLVDGVAATLGPELPSGWRRLWRYFGDGPLHPETFYASMDGWITQLRHAQLEEGRFPTSYIPTAGLPVTRARDELSFHAERTGGSPVAPGGAFSRVSSAWYANERCDLIEAAPNERRVIDIPGHPRGLLLEGRRTNFFLQSENPVCHVSRETVAEERRS